MPFLLPLDTTLVIRRFQKRFPQAFFFFVFVCVDIDHARATLANISLFLV